MFFITENSSVLVAFVCIPFCGFGRVGCSTSRDTNYFSFFFKEDVVLKDTIQAAAWCRLQSFKDSVSLPEVIGMEGWEQMAASTERKSDDGGDEEKMCKKN